MKKLALTLALVPMVALAAGGSGSSPDPAPGPRGKNPEAAHRMQKRMQLALTLGLAETLDLSGAQALKLNEQIEKLAPRRVAVRQRMREAVEVLRRSAKGEKVAAGDVDQAVTSLLDARAQLQAIDRELVTTVTKDQPPEKRARAVLFLAKFHRRVAQGFGGMGHHHMGGGMHGPDGHGMGHGGHGAGSGHGGAEAGPLGMAEDGVWEG
jgi:hypothetical protein